MATWTYVVIGYGNDGLPINVSSFESQDIRRFTRGFTEEFMPQMEAHEFMFALIKLVTEFDTGVVETRKGEKFSAKLKLEEDNGRD